MNDRSSLSSDIPSRFAAVAAGALLLLTLAAPVRAQQSAAPAGTGGVRALSLDEAVQTAEQRSEAVRVARAGVLRARGQQTQARSFLLPQLGATAAYQRLIQSQFEAIANRLASNDGGGGGSSDSAAASNPLTQVFASPNTVILGLAGSQALFAGGRLRAGTRAAAAGRSAAETGLVSARAQVQLDVAQAYYDAALSQRLLAIAESSLVQTERTLRQVRLARQVGNTSEFDLLRARVTRDNQRPILLQARAGRDVSLLRLRQLLDLPYGDSLTLTTPLEESLPAGGMHADAAADSADPGAAVEPGAVLAVDPAVTGAVATALAAADTAADRRATVRQADNNVTVQHNLLRATRGARLPGVSLSTNYQRFAYPSSGIPNPVDDFFPNWTVSLGVSVPILTGGRQRGDELIARANLDEARAQLEQTREFAALDAQIAVTGLEAAEATWLASAGTAEQAGRAYGIAEVRYAEGISTQVELTDARILLQQAQANRAQAARDLKVARLRLSLLRDLPIQAPGQNPAAAAQQQQQQRQRQQQQQQQASALMQQQRGASSAQQTGTATGGAGGQGPQ